MKRLFLAAILFLVPTILWAQADNRSPYYRVWGPVLINTQGYSDLSDTAYFALEVKDTTKAVRLSGNDTTGIPPLARTITWNAADSSFYYGDGVQWRKLTGSGSGQIFQLLSLSGDTLTISHGNSVVIHYQNLDSLKVNAILNQDTSKQNAVSRYKKAVLDTLTNQAAPSYPFDFRNGSNLFQWDGYRLNLKTPSAGLNIGNLSGYQNENSYQSIHIGQFSAFSSVGDSNSVTIGTGASEGSNGNYNVVVGNASALLGQGSFSTSIGYQASHNTGSSDNSTFIGNNSGYGTNSINSIYIGKSAGAAFNVTDSVVSANGKSVVDKVNATRWSGTSVADFISNNSLVVNDFYPCDLFYFGTKPNGDSITEYAGPIRIVNDSSFDIFGPTYNNYGSGDFVISINNDSKDNQIVIGNGAMADSSNQAVLGNNSTTQIKFGGAGGVRIKTSATYTQGQSPVWDSASHQLIPGVANTPNISFWIPSKIYAIEGAQTNVYFENAVYSDLPSIGFNYKVVCSKGSQMDRGFQITPLSSDSGSYPFTLEVWNGHTMLAQTKDTLVVTTKEAGTGTRNIVMVGNSLMSGGQIVDTLMSDYGSGNLSFNFQGTVPTGSDYHTEGHSGWKWADFATSGRTAYQLTVSGISTNPDIGDKYTTNGSTFQIFGENISEGSGDIEFQLISGTNAPITSGGTLTRASGSGDASITYSASSTISGNPFWNPSTSKIDLDYYKTTNSITLDSGDWVTFELGINDFASLTSEQAAETELAQVCVYIDSIIDEFQRDVPGLRIAIMLPAPGFNQDGFGINYNTSIVRWRYNWNLNIYETGVIKKYDNNTYKGRNVYVVGLGNNMDLINNSILSPKIVNSRNTVTYQQTQNAVHPYNPGYAQYADVYYSLFKWFK